jgi:DNA polymerase-1
MRGIFDGDVVAYRAAAAVQKNIDWDGDGDVSQSADPREAIKAAKQIIDSWSAAAGIDEAIILQSDRRAPKTSFRYLVHPRYKAQRSGEKPVVLLEVEEWLRKYRGATYFGGLEGDDALGIAATGEMKGSVTISTDKDMRTIPGKCFIVPHMRPLGTARVERITTRHADGNVAMQAICGDSVDNYKGAPGVGPKKADEFLQEDLWQGVVAAFEWSWEKRPQKHDVWVHPGDPRAEALMNMRCAYILRDGDYRPETGEVGLWCPGGDREWIKPF